MITNFDGISLFNYNTRKNTPVKYILIEYLKNSVSTDVIPNHWGLERFISIVLNFDFKPEKVLESEWNHLNSLSSVCLWIKVEL